MHDVVLLHTGQHYDQRMSGNFFATWSMPEPNINLAVGSGSHAQQTARIMVDFEQVCLLQRPDWVVVVGDVNSTIACAADRRASWEIRVAHVEAGLRSRDMSMPEEINRLCTDAISDLLFTTDASLTKTFGREGVAEARIRFVGNTMIDSLLAAHRARRAGFPLPGWKWRRGTMPCSRCTGRATWICPKTSGTAILGSHPRSIADRTL